jgi:hypothetical protein
MMMTNDYSGHFLTVLLYRLRNGHLHVIMVLPFPSYDLPFGQHYKFVLGGIAVMTLAEGTQLFATYLRFDEPLLSGNYSPPISPASSPSSNSNNTSSLLPPARMLRGGKNAIHYTFGVILLGEGVFLLFMCPIIGSGTGNILFEHVPSEPPSPTTPYEHSLISPTTPAATVSTATSSTSVSLSTTTVVSSVNTLPTSISLPIISTPNRSVSQAARDTTATAAATASVTTAGPSSLPVLASMSSLLPSTSTGTATGTIGLTSGHDGHKAPPPLPATPPNPRVGPAKMVRKGTAPALLNTPLSRPSGPAPSTPATATSAASSTHLPSTPSILTHSSSTTLPGTPSTSGTHAAASAAPPSKPSFFDRMRKQLGGKHTAPSTPSVTTSSTASSSSSSLLTSPAPLSTTATITNAASILSAPPAHPHPSYLMSPPTTSNPPSPRHGAAGRTQSVANMFASPSPNLNPSYLPSTPASMRPISMSIAPATPASSSLTSSSLAYGVGHGSVSMPATPMGAALPAGANGNNGSVVHSRTYSMPFAGATSPLALAELQAKMQVSQLYIPRTICLVSHYPVVSCHACMHQSHDCYLHSDQLACVLCIVLLFV